MGWDEDLAVLRERFAGHVREHTIAERSTADALKVAVDALNAYKATANEFRGSLADQRNEFVTRAEHQAWGSRIDSLEDDKIARDAEHRTELANATERHDRDRREADRERFRLGIIVSCVSIVASGVVAVALRLLFG